MTKTEVISGNEATAVVREPRPFLWLKPARLPLRDPELDPAGCQWLQDVVTPCLPQLARGLVQFTIERHNLNSRSRGHVQPIPMSVLNRRRRAARSWLLAIAEGRIDAATRHAAATQWLPLLCGSGPNLAKLARPARVLIEYVRGAMTACIFDEAGDNLLPEARALAVLEGALAAHLAEVARVAARENAF